MSPATGRSGSAERMAAVAAIALAGLALVRTLVVIYPAQRFDVDPVVSPFAALGWGPAQTLAVDACSLVLAGVICWVCARRGGLLEAVVVVAALLPAVAIGVHAAQSADDAWRGVSWLAAFVSAAALWMAVRTLPQGWALRASLVAVLASAAGPLLARGVAQVFIEHQATVDAYMQAKAAAEAIYGSALESPQMRLFERRLLQPEATGWFTLSNVMSSVLAALVVALGGLAVAGWRSLERGTALLLALAAAGCVALVLSNFSKGALGALALGLMAWCVARLQPPGRRWAAIGGVAAIAVALLAVVVRGWFGEAWGERSLLFRWQYWQGACAAWWSAPLLGTGPAGFAQAYLWARPARAPEEVVSAHSVAVDWIAALGITGFAWTGVLLVWGYMAGIVGGSTSPGPEHAAARLEAPPAPGRRFLLASGVMVLAACITGLVTDFPALDRIGLALRLAGVALALVLTVAVIQVLETHSRTACGAIFGAVIVLLTHAQLEMTAWTLGSAGWVLAFVAVGAAGVGGGSAPGMARAQRRESRAPRITLMTCGGVMLALAGVVALRELPPAWREAAALETAAAPLDAYFRPDGATPAAAPVEARATAARALLDRDDQPAPWRDRPLRLVAGLRQWESALHGTPADAPAFAPLAAEALAAAEDAAANAPVASVLTAAQEVAQQATRSPDPLLARKAWEMVAAYAQRQVERHPRNVQAWLALARAKERLGETQAAHQAYRRALDADASYALDPLRQLGARERTEIERRITETAPGGDATGAPGTASPSDAAHGGVEAPSE